MAKSDGGVRRRLQQAAVELFREQGFERATAADIAARAGVTERTFFRHFPDKREVLFDGQAVLLEALLAAVADAPPDLGPLDTLFCAFHSARALLEANRPFAKPRHEVIAATPALTERELAKTAALAQALAQALRARGVPDIQATLAAQVGMSVFAEATIAWLEDSDPGLAERFDTSRRELRMLL